MAEKINLGSVYSGREFQRLEPDCKLFKQFSLGNTIAGREISWIQAGKRLIADREIMLNVSLNDIRGAGFDIGRPVMIDGKHYFCRCLRPASPNIPVSEWDGLMNELGESDELWHWSENFFWEMNGTLRGKFSARYKSGGVPYNHKTMDFGFRPVLEPLALLPADLGGLIGKQVWLYSRKSYSSISGTLVSSDDYDLVLDGQPINPLQGRWVKVKGKKIVVDRSMVLCIRMSPCPGCI